MTLTRRQLDRRQLLKVAGVAGTGALAALAPTAALAESEEGRSIVGSWLVNVTQTSGTGAPHQVLILYAPGGVVAGSSSNDPAGLIGSWARTGENQSRATFLLFVFASGHSIGMLRVREEATVAKDGDHLTGRAVLEFIPSGGTPVPAGTTTFTGTRIKVESL